MLKPAAEKLAVRLAAVSFKAPAIPVLHNADVECAPTPEAIRVALTKQAASPVRWVETIERLAREDVTHIAECGPGKVLAGLNKRIAPDIVTFALTDGAALDAARLVLVG